MTLARQCMCRKVRMSRARKYSREADRERTNTVLTKALPECLITALHVLHENQV